MVYETLTDCVILDFFEAVKLCREQLELDEKSQCTAFYTLKIIAFEMFDHRLMSLLSYKWSYKDLIDRINEARKYAKENCPSLSDKDWRWFPYEYEEE